MRKRGDALGRLVEQQHVLQRAQVQVYLVGVVLVHEGDPASWLDAHFARLHVLVRGERDKQERDRITEKATERR